MAWVAFLLEAVYELFRRLYWARFEIARNLQQLFSGLSLGLFVQQSSESDEGVEKIFDAMDTIIKAHIFLAGLPLIISAFRGEIESNELLNNYFLQFPAWARYQAEKYLKTYSANISGLYREVFEDMAMLYYRPDLYENAQEYVFNPIQFWVDLANILLVELFEPIQDWLGFAKHFVEIYRHDDYDIEKYSIPEWLCYWINPFLSLDWAIIKSEIIIMMTYYKIFFEVDVIGQPKPFFKQAEIALIVDDEVVDVAPLGRDGFFQLNFSLPPKELHRVKVDLYGLQQEVTALSVLRASNIYVKDTGMDIMFDDPQRSKVDIAMTYNETLDAFFLEISGVIEDWDDWDFDDFYFIINEYPDKVRVVVYGGEHAFEYWVHIAGKYITTIPGEERDLWHVIFIDKETWIAEVREPDGTIKYVDLKDP